MLKSADSEALLEQLCVTLGFCLPPKPRRQLQADPPPDTAAFTEAVFRAEGLEPMADRRLYRQVAAVTAEAFGRVQRPHA